MATLAEINQTLISVDENTQKTSRGIQGFLDYLEEKRRDDLEAEREEKAQRVQANQTITKSAGGTGGGFKLPSLNLGGLSKGLAGLLTVGGALSLARAIGGRLIKRGLFAAVGVALADTIADKLVVGNDQASNQLRTTLSNAITGGVLGATLFGRKGGIIGLVGGALLTNPKTKEAFKNLGTNLEEFGKKLFGDVDVKGTLANAVNTMSGLLGDGVTSINNLLTGESKNVGKDIAGSLATLGGLAFLVSPRLTSKAGKATLLGLLNAFKKAGPRGKAVAAILGLLGLSLAEDGVGVVGGDIQGPPRPPENDDTLFGADKNTLIGSGAAIATSKVGQTLASQYAKNATVARPTTMTGNYAMQGSLKPAEITKYQRLQKILKIIGRGGLAGLGIAFEYPAMRDIILDDSLSDKEKAKKMAPIIARSLGTVGFASIGSRIGAFIPIKGSSILGGILGGIAGYFGGDYAGQLLGEWLLGGDPKLPADKAEQLQKSMTSKLMKAVAGQGKKEFGTGIRTSKFQDISSTAGLGMEKLPSVSASNIGNNITPMYPQFDGPGASASNVVNSGNTNTTTTNNVGTTVVDNSSAFDAKHFRSNLANSIL
tara:strand:- start:192 stop:1988 length:1797 start_codon:yes stop_codon:yes gene_type:complete